MPLDDLRHVHGAHLRVPDAVRVNEDGRADGAEADRTAIGQQHAPFRVAPFGRLTVKQPTRRQLACESRFDLSAPGRRAGFSGTDKDVPPELLLEGLDCLVQANYVSLLKKGTASTVKAAAKRMQYVYEANMDLAENVQPKLVLSRLFLQI